MQEKSEELASKLDPAEGQEQQRANGKDQSQAENQTSEDKQGQHDNDKGQSEAKNQTSEEDKQKQHEDCKGQSEAKSQTSEDKQGQHEDDKGQSEAVENQTSEEDKEQTLSIAISEQKVEQKQSSDNSEEEENSSDSESSRNENDEPQKNSEKEKKLKREKSNESSEKQAVPSSEKEASANQKQRKSKWHGNIEETAIDETECTEVGQEQVPLIAGKQKYYYLYYHALGKKSVFNYSPKLNELRKYTKTLGKKCKDLGEQLKINEKKSFDVLIKKWKKEKPVPYTWDTFLSALRAIGEATLAEEIEGNKMYLFL